MMKDDAAYIFNVTCHVDHSIAAAWKVWMLEHHIPKVMATECFSNFRMVKLVEVDESEGLTYAIQYFVPAKAMYNAYLEKYAPALRAETSEKWGERVIAFRTLMEVVQ